MLKYLFFSKRSPRMENHRLVCSVVGAGFPCPTLPSTCMPHPRSEGLPGAQLDASDFPRVYSTCRLPSVGSHAACVCPEYGGECRPWQEKI